MITVLLWGLKVTVRRVLPGALTFPTPLLSAISCTGKAPDSHIQKTRGQKRSRGCSGSTEHSALWAPWPVPSCVRGEEGFLGMAKAHPHSTVLQGPPIRAATTLSLTSHPHQAQTQSHRLLSSHLEK